MPIGIWLDISLYMSASASARAEHASLCGPPKWVVQEVDRAIVEIDSDHVVVTEDMIETEIAIVIADEMSGLVRDRRHVEMVETE